MKTLFVAIALIAAFGAQAAPEVVSVTPKYQRQLTIAHEQCDPGPCARSFIYDQRVVGYEVVRRDGDSLTTTVERVIPKDAKPEVVLHLLDPN
ncbi:hypothetical protein [Ramlibacter alkalitolerans]|uniref:PepSY domain-containing protein n=1 Tax=Ramlibacter alkalitolerans TaxID=2039631 RepID=A0ABS1JTW4_9BURK|nr:hypothetical protein [Ramlibacter alkalitolerans]MBL0427735.1 hypothetical protein [Ramlibacter alkalitolerans]